MKQTTTTLLLALVFGALTAEAQTKVPAPVKAPAQGKPAAAKMQALAKPAGTKAPAPVKAAPAAVKAPETAPAMAPALEPAPAQTAASDKAKPDNGPAVRYAMSFPNAVHHEARVTATFSGLPAGPLHVRIARSSPGRYSLHDFAKNVYYVVATDGSNHPLYLNRPDPYGWDVSPAADGTVVFSYTLYGDRTDGTYVGIDQQHAHLNLPAALCYATGLEGRQTEVKFDLPATWKVATQLRPGADKTTFSAPNM